MMASQTLAIQFGILTLAIASTHSAESCSGEVCSDEHSAWSSLLQGKVSGQWKGELKNNELVYESEGMLNEEVKRPTRNGDTKNCPELTGFLRNYCQGNLQLCQAMPDKNESTRLCEEARTDSVCLHALSSFASDYKNVAAWYQSSCGSPLALLKQQRQEGNNFDDTVLKKVSYKADYTHEGTGIAGPDAKWIVYSFRPMGDIDACFAAVREHSECTKDYFSYDRVDNNCGCKTSKFNKALEVRQHSQVDYYKIKFGPSTGVHYESGDLAGSSRLETIEAF